MIPGDIDGAGPGDIDCAGVQPAGPPTDLIEDLDISGWLTGMTGYSMPRPPPPFLAKIYNIVNDPKTDSIVSWSQSGTSFIIWDHHKFPAEILPLHFKHNNLSSFVSQLNLYGFRKIGVAHQWEYEHPYFQAGNEFMLSNIKRRNQILGKAIRRRQPKKKGSCKVSNANDDMEKELKALRDEINILKLEIEEYKKQQQDTELLISTLVADMNKVRNEPNRLLMILSEMGAAHKLSEEVEKNNSDDRVGGKRKSDHTHEISVDKEQ